MSQENYSTSAASSVAIDDDDNNDIQEAFMKAVFCIVGLAAAGIVFARFARSVTIKQRNVIDAEKNVSVVLECCDDENSENDEEKIKKKDALEYLISSIKSKGLSVNLINKHVAIGVTDDRALRIADQMSLRRKNLKGEFASYSLDQALDFPTTITTGERIVLIQHVLDTLRVGKSPSTSTSFFQQDDAMVHKALQQGLLSSTWCVHDDAEKAALMNNWVKDFKSLTAQPLDSVRDYFGDQIAFYFGFIGLYTSWLRFPAIFGSVVFIYQIFYGSSNFVTAFYALSVTIWATAFLEYWKRAESEYGYRWGVLEIGDVEHERPEFRGERVYDRVTEAYVTKFTAIEQAKRYAKTVPALLGSLLVVIFITFLFFQLDAFVNKTLTTENGYDGFVMYLALLPMILYSVVVFIMDSYYIDFATKLNEFENHRTDSEYANALVIKLASFYFVNNFGLLFYIAFFVRDFDLLTETLSSLLVTRQVLGNVQETIIPYVMSKRGGKPDVVKTTSCDKESKIKAEGPLVPYEGTFDDCLELFVQFGQVTLFAAAYPLAGLCSLLNNVIEIRSDGFKLITTHRRPLPVTCKGIGTWLHAFEILGYIAVLTNCTLIGFNSGQLEKWFPNLSAAQTIVMIVTAEHLMIVAKLLIEVIVPDVPSHILDAQKRERVTLKQLEKETKKQELLSTRRKDSTASTGGEKKTDGKKERAPSLNSEEYMEWVQEERQRRVTLEKEVNRLSELYMAWVKSEQSRRKTLEAKLERLERKDSFPLLEETKGGARNRKKE